MEPFKNIYSQKSNREVSSEIKKHYKKFDEEAYLKTVNKGLNRLEMKERVVQISEGLHQFLPGPYERNIRILSKTLKNKKGDGLSGFLLWPYSHYIETYGMEDFEISMEALYEITKRFTAEFGIRPFLEVYPEEVYQFLEQCLDDKDEHIRRWVSEGTRPNLPWGKKVSHLQQNLKRNIKLLETLKDDESEYVRKSVANHMNDISWIDSKLTIKTLKKWQKNSSKNTQWIIRHALRSLLKKGDKEALQLMGYESQLKMKLSQLDLSKKKIREGDSFDLNLELKNQEKTAKKFMIDYVIYYPKLNGELSPKVFKLKSCEIGGGESLSFSKKVSFKKVTTRKHYPGKHRLEIQVNGVVIGQTLFELLG